MTVEGMMYKEWLDELAAASDDELIEKLRFFSCAPYFYDLFDPLVEEIQKRLNKAEPVRRGKWLLENIGKPNEHCVCSECGTQVDSDEAWRYCPWCGAKMEEQGVALLPVLRRTNGGTGMRSDRDFFLVGLLCGFIGSVVTQILMGLWR